MHRLALVIPIVLPLPAQVGPEPVRLGAGVTSLDDVGLYRVGARYAGGEEREMPAGWTGHFEEETGLSCTPFGRQDGKRAFLLHCPWRGATGVGFQEFTLALPEAERITLSFAIALKADVVGRSDGAEFRVLLNGRPLLNETRADAVWAPHSYDLTALAGETATITFESGPGPEGNASWDYALWGDRNIAIAGAEAPADPIGLPPYSLDGLCAPAESVRPQCAFRHRNGVMLDAGRAILAYSGEDGDIRYLYTPGPQFLDGLVAEARQLTGDTVELRPLADAHLVLEGPDGSLVRSDASGVAAQLVSAEVVADALVVKQRYTVGGRAVDTICELAMRGKSLRVEVTGQAPWIAAVNLGSLGPVPLRRRVDVPYLGTVTYLPEGGLFQHTILDWTESNAASHVGPQANYDSLTDGSRNLVHEVGYATMAWSLREVLPNPPSPASPFRDTLAGKIVLDIWGGRFREIAAGLEELHSYGITNCAAIVHVWQHGGYDNELPDVLPAMPELGGDEDMKRLAGTARRLGYLFGVHENYVDFYPNSRSWDPDDVALNPDGSEVEAWRNKVQSYGYRPNAILRYAQRFSPEIHARYGTTAAYLDVHSAVAPWFHVDHRTGGPGAGTFAAVWDAHKELFARTRQWHEGPVLGEGGNHWYWSGLLDGVEAQFPWGHTVGVHGGEDAPLAVDFDLLKLHPLQANHGMGYYSRWLSEGGQGEWGSPIPPQVVMDQYRLQQVAYGHGGFLGAETWRFLPYAWQEHHLMSPVSARCATARPASIRYEVDGRLVPAREAVAAGSAMNRVRVEYDNGLAVRANQERDAWRVADGPMLPQFGWYAKGAGLEAYSALRGGKWADFARTRTSVFANARTSCPDPETGRVRIRPSVAEFRHLGGRRISLVYRWDVEEAPGRGWHVFVHSTNPEHGVKGDVAFFPTYEAALPPDAWEAGATIVSEPSITDVPADLPDGDYELRIGLWNGADSRLPILGRDDGVLRIIVGTLRIRNGGADAAFDGPGEEEAARQWELYRRDTNPPGTVVDFGPLATDGSVRLRKEQDGSWRLWPFPRDTAFALTIRARELDPAATWQRLVARGVDAAGKPLGSLEAEETEAGSFRLLLGLPNAASYVLVGR